MATKIDGSAVSTHSVIDRGTTLKGSMTATTPVLIQGVLEGEVTGPAVEIDVGGKLMGKARVTELRCRGEMAGEFDADEVELSGRVHDDSVIRARALLVSPAIGPEGEVTANFGECQIEVGDPPSKEQVIAQATAGGRLEEGEGRSRPVVAVDGRREPSRPQPFRPEVPRLAPGRLEPPPPPNPLAGPTRTETLPLPPKVILS